MMLFSCVQNYVSTIRLLYTLRRVLRESVFVLFDCVIWALGLYRLSPWDVYLINDKYQASISRREYDDSATVFAQHIVLQKMVEKAGLPYRLVHWWVALAELRLTILFRWPSSIFGLLSYVTTSLSFMLVLLQ